MAMFRVGSESAEVAVRQSIHVGRSPSIPIGRPKALRTLESLGWDPFFAQQMADGSATDRDLTPARVIEEQRGSYRILGVEGPWYAELAGRLRHDMGPAAPGSGSLMPCVGDWVLAFVPSGGASPGQGGVARIDRVLARRTKFSRKASGVRTAEQVIAANVDTVFLVQSLNRDLNPRRLERYLALLWESGAEPVVVLSKADLGTDPEGQQAAIADVVRGAAVHLTSAVTPGGLDLIRGYLQPGKTIALVGSSGVGKSTIVNQLAGEDLMRVQSLRADDRGKHTTTARYLVVLPGGGMLLDTPGMRTILMWEGEEGLTRTFEDIEELAGTCRFRDCTHGPEPGCAIREALANGELDPGRYQGYLKLQREIRHHARQTDVSLRLAEQRRWRQIHMEQRRRPDKRHLR